MLKDNELLKISASLAALKKQYLKQKVYAGALQAKTNRLIRITFLSVGIMALINLYYVNDLTREIKIISKSMVEMYTHFGEMSTRMSKIRYYVQNMGESMRDMDIMVEQMSGMSSNMSTMSKDVTGMRQSLVSMKTSVSDMNGDINEMAGRFHSMNRSVSGMGYNIDQMSDIIPGK